MKVTKPQLIKALKDAVKGAPGEVKQAASDYIDALADFPPGATFSVSEANRVWNDDLPDAHKGRFPIKP